LAQNSKSQGTSVLNFADVLLDSRNEKFFGGTSTEVPQIIQNEIDQLFRHLQDILKTFEPVNENVVAESKYMAFNVSHGCVKVGPPQ